MLTIKQLCEESHKTAVEKGFWDKERPVSELLMLIVTELGEACEADRKANKENFNEEIADTFIRLGDMCQALNIDIDVEIEKKMEYNKTRPYKHGKKY